MAGKQLVIRLFIVLNVLTAIVFLLACWAPYINPSNWFLITVLCLGSSIFLTLLCLYIFFWSIVKPLFVLLSIVNFLLGCKRLSVFFAVNSQDTFTYANHNNTTRVITWNV